MKEISAILLAGGKSKRFGSNKRDIVFSSETLIASAIKKLNQIAEDIIIVLSPDDNSFNYQEKVVFDQISDKGPLIGIYSGLKNIRNEKSIVIPIDTPFISIEFLQYLVESSNDFDAVIPLWNNCLEPLIGIYSMSIINDLENWIHSGNKMAPHLFLESLNKPRINFINESNIRKFGNPEKLFLNINTTEDLNKAQSLI